MNKITDLSTEVQAQIADAHKAWKAADTAWFTRTVRANSKEGNRLWKNLGETTETLLALTKKHNCLWP